MPPRLGAQAPAIPGVPDWSHPSISIRGHSPSSPASERQRRAETEVEAAGEPGKARKEPGPRGEERAGEEAGERGRLSETIAGGRGGRGLDSGSLRGRRPPARERGSELRGPGQGAGVGRGAVRPSIPHPRARLAPRPPGLPAPQVQPLRVAACALLPARAHFPLRGTASAPRKGVGGPGGAAPVAMETRAALGTATGDGASGPTRSGAVRALLVLAFASQALLVPKPHHPSL